MGLKFIRAEDGSYIQVRNITRLCVETSYDDKSTIRAHHNGPSMPFAVARFETSREAHMWLMDLVDRIEVPNPEMMARNRKRNARALEDTEP